VNQGGWCIYSSCTYYLNDYNDQPVSQSVGLSAPARSARESLEQYSNKNAFGSEADHINTRVEVQAKFGRRITCVFSPQLCRGRHTLQSRGQSTTNTLFTLRKGIIEPMARSYSGFTVYKSQSNLLALGGAKGARMCQWLH
jgi:hypothetical protein